MNRDNNDIRLLEKYIYDELLLNNKQYIYQKNVYRAGFDALIEKRDSWYMVGNQEDLEIVYRYISSSYKEKRCIDISSENNHEDIMNGDISNNSEILVIARSDIEKWITRLSSIDRERYHIVGAEMIKTLEEYMRDENNE